MDKSEHAYLHEHGIPHEHGHHGHTHTPEETRAVVNRLARAIGHLERVKAMVAEGRDCTEVLVQLSAVKSALNNAGTLILQNHIEHCIVDAVKSGDMDAVADLNRAISRYMK